MIAATYAVDFYISDFQSGQRALVRKGYGTRVTSYVDESVVTDINPDNKDMSWDPETAMRKECFKWWSYNVPKKRVLLFLLNFGVIWNHLTCTFTCRYIKEGSRVCIVGVVQRNDNVLMIVHPSEPISTGCQSASGWSSSSWLALMGLVLSWEDTSNMLRKRMPVEIPGFIVWLLELKNMCKCRLWLWLSTISTVCYLGIGCIVFYVFFSVFSLLLGFWCL